MKRTVYPKLIIFSVLSLCLMIQDCLAIQWAKTYGGISSDEAFSVCQTNDGGYIVAGYTYSSGAGNSDIWILKLDASGNVTWQKTYGGTLNESLYQCSIQQTREGGYIVTGYNDSFDARMSDFWILKLDSSGTVTWQKEYSGTGNDRANSMQQTTDGGYIVAGFAYNAGNADMWILKLDNNGIISWENRYGGSGEDEAYAILQTTDGGYIVAGYTDSFGAGEADMWILKLDSGGNVVWQKTYGGTGADYARSIQQTTDGEYIVAGYGVFAGVSNEMLILKLDQSGMVTWQKNTVVLLGIMLFVFSRPEMGDILWLERLPLLGLVVVTFGS